MKRQPSKLIPLSEILDMEILKALCNFGQKMEDCLIPMKRAIKGANQINESLLTTDELLARLKGNRKCQN